MNWLAPGKVVADRYLIERELGQGGMATVWQARDLRQDRPVAIKVLRGELASGIGVDRFLREIRLTVRLQHPNVVPVLDSGVLPAPGGESLPWYVMPYLEGESLRQRMTREGQLPLDDALRIVRAVGNALAAAHGQGIVHRDIKPENVVLSGEAVYVLDFGIAKALIDTGAERLTSTGLAIGTPAYMSPEQAETIRVDARSDQYSLAALLYEMLAGEPPFSGPTAQAVIARRMAEPARALRPVRSTVPVPVEEAILRALERAPADRFPDVAAFLAALNRGAATARQRKVPRKTGIAALALTGLLGAAGWVVASWSSRSRDPNPEVLALQARATREYDKRTPEGIRSAVRDFRAVLERDSGLVPAWTGLAKSYIRAELRSFPIPGLPHDQLLREAASALDRALLLDSSSADAWLAQAQVASRLDPTDLAPALRAIRRSLALDSTAPAAWHELARMSFELGQVDSAMAAWRRAVTLGPAYSQGLAFLAQGHYWRHNFDSAAKWADSAIAVDPTYILARTTAAEAAIELGQFARGEAGFEAARRLSGGVEAANALAGRALARARSGDRQGAQAILRQADSAAQASLPLSSHTAVYLARAYVAVGESGRAIEWLARYEAPRDLHFQVHLRCDPPLAPLHSNPRFRALLEIPRPPPGRGC